MPLDYILLIIKHLEITLQAESPYLARDLQDYIIIIILWLLLILLFSYIPAQSQNLTQHCSLANIVLKFCDPQQIGQFKTLLAPCHRFGQELFTWV